MCCDSLRAHKLTVSEWYNQPKHIKNITDYDDKISGLHGQENEIRKVDISLSIWLETENKSSEINLKAKNTKEKPTHSWWRVTQYNEPEPETHRLRWVGPKQPDVFKGVEKELF